MAPEDSLSCSEISTSEIYLEPAESSQHLYIIIKIHFNIILLSPPRFPN
jgi:hypothetical protein